MCGRYASAKRDIDLVPELDVDVTVGEQPPPSWNVAPTQEARVVVVRPPHARPDEPLERQLRTMRWGLVPSWAKDPKIGSRLINARADTVTQKAAYQAAAARRRCLVPADGYFEWERRLDRSGTVPHFLHRPGRLLAFAGLYEMWPDPSLPRDAPGRWLWTFTIVTTTAADAVGHIHDRSPVVVPPELRDDWLDPHLTDAAGVQRLLDSMPDPRLEAYEVSPAVNNHRNNGAHLIAPV